MWNDDFGLRDGFYSVSDIQDYIKYIIKNIEHYPLIYINKSKRLAFKIKDGYELELQTPETMKLFGSTKQINRQNR